MTVNLYGLDFPDDEYQIMVINGEPEVVLNRAGVLRACDHAPNQEVAAQFRAWLDAHPPKRTP